MIHFLNRRLATAVLVAAIVALTLGCPGPAGPPCTVTDNGSGKKTITCPDGTSAVVNDGTSGTSCTVTDNGNGTKTISCANGTSVTVSNGASGDAGTACTVADNGNGTKTITCGNGTTVTIANGDAGPAGTSCSVSTNSDGSKTISCTDGTSVTVTPPINTRLDPRDDLPGVVLTVTSVSGASNTDGTFAAGDHPVVTFTVTNAAGAKLDLADLDSVDTWISGPTSNYQHILPVARDEAMISDVKTAAVHNANGSWTYTYTAAIPASYGTPLWDTTRFSDGELTGALQAGTYTLVLRAEKDFKIGSRTYKDVGEQTKDFRFGHATTLEPREVTTTGNCNRCHEQLTAHEDSFHSAKVCVTCHTSGAEDENSFVGTVDGGVDPTPVTIDFRVMIHKIHNGAHLPSVLGIGVSDAGVRTYGNPSVPYKVGDGDFSGVQFPALPNLQNPMPRNAGYSALSSSFKTIDDTLRKGATKCVLCHGAAPSGTAPAQGDNYRLLPSRRACGACHDDLDYTKPFSLNGLTMPAQANDTQCFTCHGDAGIAGGPPSTVGAHAHPMDPTLVPDYAFHLTSFTNGADGGTAIALGDVPHLTFTLKDGAGADVPMHTMDAFIVVATGPTSNRQVPMPYGYSSGTSFAACNPIVAACAGSAAVVPAPYSAVSTQSSPYDYVGRLHSAFNSSGNAGANPRTDVVKGIMSKVVPTATTTSDVLTVQFAANGTDFTVTGLATGALGSGSLAAATSSYPKGTTVSNIILSPTVAAGAVAVNFSSATDYTVMQGSTTLGTGTLPAATCASGKCTATATRFVSPTISFNIAVANNGGAFASGNTINLTVFKGAAANPVAFAIVAGNLAYSANDRFYYDYAAPAATYTMTIPMDIALETLGVPAGGTALPPPANTPVWYGRQSLFEVTGVTTTTTSLLISQKQFARAWVVTSAAAFKANDYVVVDTGANQEYLNIANVDSAAGVVWFRTPARFAHAASTAMTKVTVAFRQEGTDYTLNTSTGASTLAAASTNPFIMNYRTDGHFGWKRFVGDSVQATYFPPMTSDQKMGANGVGVYDESWGDYGGKPLLAGTYTVGIFANPNLDVVKQNEVVTYRTATLSERYDFLFGGATTVTPYSLISDGDNCDACHVSLAWHGGSRRNANTCLLCHAVAGIENTDNGYESKTVAGAITGGVSGTANYRTFIHQLHGESFPARGQNGFIYCTKCHGSSDVWQGPTDRTYPGGTPVRNWQAPCVGCHSDTDARGHMNAMTPASGDESCPVCHEVGAEFDSTVLMKPR